MPAQENKTQTIAQQTQSTDASDAIIQVIDVKKSFRVGEQDIQVLKGLNMHINYGDFAVIFGPSGCGKSTYLHVLLGLEPPSSGTIKFLGQDIYQDSDENTRAEFRKRHVGMVYQQANWVKALTVQENVAFPLMLLGIEKPQAMSKAYDLLRQVDMQDWGGYIPTELSGGQQQRVSLARALVNNPEIIIADEPTGNLDYQAGQNIMNLFKRLNAELNKTVIMVTHDLEYLTYAKTAVQMLDGTIVGVFGEEEKDKLYETLKFKRLDSIKPSDEGAEANVGEDTEQKPEQEVKSISPTQPEQPKQKDSIVKDKDQKEQNEQA